jgi:hypothetical protein
MKKLIALAAFFIGFNASAGIISIELNDTDINIGDTLSISINAIDFDETDNFFFDFEFLTSLLMLDENSVSSDLVLLPVGSMDDGLIVEAVDFIGLGFNFVDFFMPVNGNFNIASFNLTAMQTGTSNFEIASFFSIGAFDDYDVIFSGTNSINITSQAVPEPSSVAMMMLAGFAMFSSRRKLANKTK